MVYDNLFHKFPNYNWRKHVFEEPHYSKKNHETREGHLVVGFGSGGKQTSILGAMPLARLSQKLLLTWHYKGWVWITRFVSLINTLRLLYIEINTILYSGFWLWVMPFKSIWLLPDSQKIFKLRVGASRNRFVGRYVVNRKILTIFVTWGFSIC